MAILVSPVSGSSLPRSNISRDQLGQTKQRRSCGDDHHWVVGNDLLSRTYCSSFFHVMLKLTALAVVYVSRLINRATLPTKKGSAIRSVIAVIRTASRSQSFLWYRGVVALDHFDGILDQVGRNALNSPISSSGSLLLQCRLHNVSKSP